MVGLATTNVHLPLADSSNQLPVRWLDCFQLVYRVQVKCSTNYIPRPRAPTPPAHARSSPPPIPAKRLRRQRLLPRKPPRQLLVSCHQAGHLAAEVLDGAKTRVQHHLQRRKWGASPRPLPYPHRGPRRTAIAPSRRSHAIGWNALLTSSCLPPLPPPTPSSTLTNRTSLKAAHAVVKCIRATLTGCTYLPVRLRCWQGRRLGGTQSHALVMVPTASKSATSQHGELFQLDGSHPNTTCQFCEQLLFMRPTLLSSSARRCSIFEETAETAAWAAWTRMRRLRSLIF